MKCATFCQSRASNLCCLGLITVQCAVSCQHVLKSSNYFNLRYFSYRSSDRLQRRNAKSTQSIRPQTFAASEPVSYRALLCPAVSCPAISCPAHWSFNFHVQHFQRPHYQQQNMLFHLAAENNIVDVSVLVFLNIFFSSNRSLNFEEYYVC